MAILKKSLILTFSVLLVLTFGVLAFSAGFNMGAVPVTPAETGIQYHASVLATHYDASTGETIVVAKGSNVLYNTGKNMTRSMLNGGGGAILNISLCNATAGCGAVTEAKAEAYNEITLCGLKSVAGTYKTHDGIADGNWSVGNVFTSTCDSVVINVTRIENATGHDFAGRNLSTVNLDTNDQLTVNWTIWVT